MDFDPRSRAVTPVLDSLYTHYSVSEQTKSGRHCCRAVPGDQTGGDLDRRAVCDGKQRLSLEID
jgi:hypothetical protein